MLIDNTNQPDSPINILIVNNDPDALAMINASVQTLAHANTSCVDSAQKALRVLRQQTIDLLIVDVNIPDMDGWRLSRLVRSGILLCRVDLPIVITAQTWCERIAEVTAREYGINQLLPLEHLQQLPAVVKNLTRQKETITPKPRLLVVEDEPDTADLIRRILSGAFDIEFANEGDAGLRAWVQGRQDLVLLDVMLPKLSGRDILMEIHSIDANQPVVIMTAHTTIDQAEELMLMGAVDFLPKPFRAEQLRKVCDIAIHRDDYLVSNAQFAARVNDVQEREREYRALYESHHQLLNDLQSVVMELDADFKIQYLNHAWETMMGFPVSECIGQSLEAFIAIDDFNQYSLFKNKIRKTLQSNKPCPEFELCLSNYRGQKLWAQLKVSRSTRLQDSENLTICLDNITERRESQEQLKYLAMHDSLTGLYNRHFFESTLAQLTADSVRNNRQHALVYLDLDHFKVINDTFGHQKGDEVLREMSHLLSKRIRGTDILCRLGGDEFAILLRDIKAHEVYEFARNIQQIVAEFTFQLQEQRISLGSSIGLTLIDGSTNNAEEHLMRADIALYVAKGRGRNLIHQYDPLDSESDELRHSINTSQKIRKAIMEDRMVLYFQPIFDIKNNRVSYYEALVRLREPDGRILGPDTFIPALESAGEMHLLDRWIIKLAIHTLHNHPELNHIAINLSAQAFKDENLVPTILENLTATGVNPKRITFELTESASLFNLHITQKVIADLHKLGCSFSVDDFGSGFSSFAYLKDLPADYIKLDGSFIQNLHRDQVDQTLVKSMIQVIQALGKKAVAEYVENEAILEILKSMNVDFVQGYHIGHPLPVERLLLKQEIASS
ncbi:EAL domain-containing protein [Cellvibrio sp. KY-GH-1]|uniref:GGDEF/EAL domain-containing response regulator n=1 Tax=Cellvibrio sp. KY-GH-1 TaxID=2303332 RepID=UPI001CD93E0E|nr:EAL domain-containing protein [Cellvibrio sp. KY-GH-1]